MRTKGKLNINNVAINAHGENDDKQPKSIGLYNDNTQRNEKTNKKYTTKFYTAEHKWNLTGVYDNYTTATESRKRKLNESIYNTRKCNKFDDATFTEMLVNHSIEEIEVQKVITGDEINRIILKESDNELNKTEIKILEDELKKYYDKKEQEIWRNKFYKAKNQRKLETGSSQAKQKNITKTEQYIKSKNTAKKTLLKLAFSIKLLTDRQLRK
ncbi:MAG: hypothetical protein HRT42_14910 [Campylobacteraceae bacterium]|nr:hypothetical protein [Campylobacteraceae bacterium]